MLENLYCIGNLPIFQFDISLLGLVSQKMILVLRIRSFFLKSEKKENFHVLFTVEWRIAGVFLLIVSLVVAAMKCVVYYSSPEQRAASLPYTGFNSTYVSSHLMANCDKQMWRISTSVEIFHKRHYFCGISQSLIFQGARCELGEGVRQTERGMSSEFR